MYLKFEFCSVWHFMSFIFNFQFSVGNLKFKVHWYFLCCIIGFTFSKSVQAERFRQIVYLFFQVGNVEYMGCALGRCFSHVISYQESMQFFFKNLKDKSPFHGSLISIFWTSHDVCPGHQNQGGSSRLRTCERWTPADSAPCTKPVYIFYCQQGGRTPYS